MSSSNVSLSTHVASFLRLMFDNDNGQMVEVLVNFDGTPRFAVKPHNESLALCKPLEMQELYQDLQKYMTQAQARRIAANVQLAVDAIEKMTERVPVVSTENDPLAHSTAVLLTKIWALERRVSQLERKETKQ